VPESDRLKRSKVLLVEDEFLVAIATQELLENLGFDVVGPARGVEEARWLIEAHSDLLVTVLDVDLAGEKVWPIARELLDRGVPVLFVTGDAAIQDELPSDLRNVKILVKPFDESRLGQTINDILGQHGKAQCK
jgi:DNA-binding response OmpR family regulator